jgi:CheY-like chemotaxis protein
VPVVALTGYDTPENRAAAFDAGCIGYITKPIDTGEFVKQVEEFLPAGR